MSVTITPMRDTSPDFVGLVAGVDVAAGIDEAIAARIEQAMDHYAVLVLRGQAVSDAEQYAFSEHFGPMEPATGDVARPGERRLPMEINDISNLDQEGRVMARDDRRAQFNLGNQLWHTDSSFKPTPSKYSLLSARALPSSGGNTEFADMRAAWDALDETMQARCRDVVCEHSQLYSRGLLGFDDWTDEERQAQAPVPQRLVRRHAGSGRHSLYVASHAGAIRGWPKPEARLFLRDLTEHATQPCFVYRHEWQLHDLVMWDNRAVMHRARPYPYGEPRDMRRTTVAGAMPTLDEAV